MPDISMCSNNSCKLRGACYRYLAFPSLRQSYSYFEPKAQDGECPYQMSTEGWGSVRKVEEVDAKIKAWPPDLPVSER